MWRQYQRKVASNPALRRAVLHPLAAASTLAVALPVTAAVSDAKQAAAAPAAPTPVAAASAATPTPATTAVAAAAASAATAAATVAPAASPVVAAATGVAAVVTAGEIASAANAANAPQHVDPSTPEALVLMRSLPRLLPRLFQSYARPMAYASEVGESLRNVAPKLVRPMYALSWLYVVADTGLQTYQYHTELSDALAHQRTAAATAGAALATAKPSAIAAGSGSGAGAGAGGLDSKSLDNKWERLAYKFGDTFAWHSIASMLLPAATINRTVHFTSALCTKYLSAHPRVVRFAPAAAALCLIPFVIHPIDHATDWVFDRSIRKWYAHKLALPTPAAANAQAEADAHAKAKAAHAHAMATTGAKH